MMNNQFNLVDRFDSADLSIVTVAHGTRVWTFVSTPSGLDKVVGPVDGRIDDGDDLVAQNLLPAGLFDYLAQVL